MTDVKAVLKRVIESYINDRMPKTVNCEFVSEEELRESYKNFGKE